MKTMSERGLKPASVLAANRPHGDRLRYMGGCRCDPCRAANAAYERSRIEARKNGDWNGLVPAMAARRHLDKLSSQNVGRRSVAAATDIAETVLVKIMSGERKKIRARTERLILGVTTDAAADHALVDAAPSWKLIQELLDAGFTKTCIAHSLGAKTHALQLSKGQITVRHAADVKRLHQRLMASDEILVSAERTRNLIAQLRREWTPAARIAEALGNDAVLERGEVKIKSLIPRRVERVVVSLHQRLMGEAA